LSCPSSIRLPALLRLLGVLLLLLLLIMLLAAIAAKVRSGRGKAINNKLKKKNLL
jgi:high-affinity K+ transport system ATPase subunit B